MLPFLSHFLPHPEGESRAPVIHRPALMTYILFLFVFYLGLNFYKTRVPGILGFAGNIFTERVVTLTNHYRQEGGLPPLRLNSELSEAARRKAEDMFADDYWAHIAPDGTTPWDFIAGSGYEYIYAGENLAKDFQDSEKVVDAWMESLSHRQNILNGNYEDMGVAVVNGVLDGYETTLVVQIFGREAKPLAAIQTSAVEISGEAATNFSPNPTGRRAGAGGGWVAVDVFALTRGLSLSLGVLVLGFFAVDAASARRRGLVRISGHTFAHLALLLFLLGVVYLIKPGAIL